MQRVGIQESYLGWPIFNLFFWTAFQQYETYGKLLPVNMLYLPLISGIVFICWAYTII